MTYPIKLPCFHRVCKKCSVEVQRLGSCPLDRQAIDPDITLAVDIDYKH